MAEPPLLVHQHRQEHLETLPEEEIERPSFASATGHPSTTSSEPLRIGTASLLPSEETTLRPSVAPSDYDDEMSV